MGEIPSARRHQQATWVRKVGGARTPMMVLQDELMTRTSSAATPTIPEARPPWWSCKTRCARLLRNKCDGLAARGSAWPTRLELDVVVGGVGTCGSQCYWLLCQDTMPTPLFANVAANATASPANHASLLPVPLQILTPTLPVLHLPLQSQCCRLGNLHDCSEVTGYRSHRQPCD